MLPMLNSKLFPVLLLPLFISLTTCDSGTEAQQHGVGAECSVDADCTEEGQTCLDFKGGYCGVRDCTADTDCLDGSRCVAHTDDTNYCFLVCANKPECNIGRTVDNESNCSSNITFVEAPLTGVKACVPPSSSITL